MSPHRARDRSVDKAIFHELEELRLVAEMKKKDKYDKRKLKELEKTAGVKLEEWLEAQSKHESKKERKKHKKKRDKIKKLLRIVQKMGFLKK